MQVQVQVQVSVRRVRMHVCMHVAVCVWPLTWASPTLVWAGGLRSGTSAYTLRWRAACSRPCIRVMQMSILVSMQEHVRLCLHRVSCLLGLLCRRPRCPPLSCCPLMMALPPRPRLALSAQPQARHAQCRGHDSAHWEVMRWALGGSTTVHALVRHMAPAALATQTVRWVCAGLEPSGSVLVGGVCLGVGRHWAS